MLLIRKSRKPARDSRLPAGRRRRLLLEQLEGRQMLVADLTVTKIDNQDPVKAGDTLTYTITMENTSDATEAANDPELSDVIPTGTTYVSLVETSNLGFVITDP